MDAGKKEEGMCGKERQREEMEEGESVEERRDGQRRRFANQ